VFPVCRYPEVSRSIPLLCETKGIHPWTWSRRRRRHSTAYAWGAKGLGAGGGWCSVDPGEGDPFEGRRLGTPSIRRQIDSLLREQQTRRQSGCFDPGASTSSCGGRRHLSQHYGFCRLFSSTMVSGRTWRIGASLTTTSPRCLMRTTRILRSQSRLRRALGETPARPKWIVTIPGRGYSFVGEVRYDPPTAETSPPMGPNHRAPFSQLLPSLPLSS
jgi:hypothetical protein